MGCGALDSTSMGVNALNFSKFVGALRNGHSVSVPLRLYN